jgi:cytochrome P450
MVQQPAGTIATAAPGPQGSFFSGVARDLVAGAPRYLNHLADTYGPFVRFKVFQKAFYLVSDPELIREVLVTQAANFPKDDRDVAILDRAIGHGLVSANGAEHKRQRRLTQPAFHTRRIDAYAGTMVDYTTAMLDEWRDGQELDVAEAMSALTMLIVARTLFGADRVAMRHTAEDIGAAIHVLQAAADKEFQSPFLLPEWLPTGMNRQRRAAREVLYEIVDRLIAERRAQGDAADSGDLLSMLLLSRDESGDRMSDDEVRDQAVTLFVAGHETTSNALTWTWYLLSQQPAEEARLHAELEATLGGRPPALADLPRLPYTLQVIKEAMRLYPPAWVVNIRRAAADTTLGPYAVKRDDRLWLSPFIMHRRPAFFPDPERFDPDRWTPERERALPKFAYMPFGGGPRVCIGNGFALMEAHLIVAAVAQRYRLRLRPGHPIDLNAQITLSNHGGMPMTVERRTP